jgi:ABC-type transport system involved in multi-copper enzyme maturation permease subunit
MSALRSAVSAEWTKLWSVRTVWWALLAAVLLMAMGAAQYAIYVNHGDLPARDGIALNTPGAVAVLAVDLAQFALIALAMLLMTSEYSSGTIRATLAWIPSRGRLLLAKATVVAAVTAVGGVVLGFIGAGAARLVLNAPEDVNILDDVLVIGAYLAVISVFALGLGAAVRGSVLTLIVLFLVMVVVPPILTLPDNAVLNAITDGLPGVAGSHFLHRDTDPYPPAVGLLILAGWATMALLGGWRAMDRRDA